MKNIKNTLCALVATGFVLGTAMLNRAIAETVLLKNGDRLSGQILSRNDQFNLIFQTNFGAQIKIPWSSVKSIETTQNRNDSVQTFQPFSAPAQTITLNRPNADGSFTSQASSFSSPNSLPQFQIPETPAQPSAAKDPNTTKKSENTPKNPKTFKWSGRVNVGGKIESGNADSQALTFDGEVKARNDLYRFKAAGDFDWEQEEGETTENEKNLDLEIDRFVSKKWFVGSRLSLETDELEELDLRTKLGVLSGYQFYERDDLNLLIKFGIDYVNENFEQTSTESDIAGTWGLDYDQKFWDDFITAFHEHDFSVPFGDTGGFLFDSKTGIRVPVAKNIVGTAEIEFDWDNDPAPGIREDDTTYGFKIGYEW